MRKLSLPIAGVIVVLTAVSAYLYGQLAEQRRAPTPQAGMAMSRQNRAMVGKIVSIDPFHIAITTAQDGKMKTVEALVGRFTQFTVRQPWGPGEYDVASANYDAYLKTLGPADGAVIPPPPSKVKVLVTTNASPFIVGTVVGIIADDPTSPGELPYVKLISTLTKEEEAAGAVPSGFPY